MTDDTAKRPDEELPSPLLNPEQLAKALAALAAESGERCEPLTAKELQPAQAGEDPGYRTRWTQEEAIALETAEELITQMQGVYFWRANCAEAANDMETYALNRRGLEECWADRDTISIYNPESVSRIRAKYGPLVRAAHDYFDAVPEEEETLSAIAKMITTKLEAASQAVRESGEAVDRLVADLEQRKREDAARYAARDAAEEAAKVPKKH